MLRLLTCVIVLHDFDNTLLELNIDDDHSAGVEAFFFFFLLFTILNHSPGMYSSKVTGTGGCCTNCSWSIKVVAAFFCSAFLFFLASILGSFHSFHVARTTFYSIILRHRHVLCAFGCFYSRIPSIPPLVQVFLHRSVLEAHLPPVCLSTVWRAGLLIESYEKDMLRYQLGNVFSLLRQNSPPSSDWPVDGMDNILDCRFTLPHRGALLQAV